jgi:hypothetical protein
VDFELISQKSSRSLFPTRCLSCWIQDGCPSGKEGPIPFCRCLLVTVRRCLVEVGSSPRAFHDAGARSAAHVLHVLITQEFRRPFGVVDKLQQRPKGLCCRSMNPVIEQSQYQRGGEFRSGLKCFVHQTETAFRASKLKILGDHQGGGGDP